MTVIATGKVFCFRVSCIACFACIRVSSPSGKRHGKHKADLVKRIKMKGNPFIEPDRQSVVAPNINPLKTFRETSTQYTFP